MSTSKHNEMMTTREAAAYLGYSEYTLRKWRMKGTGPQGVRIGGPRAHVRYRRSALDRWIQDQEAKTESDR